MNNQNEGFPMNIEWKQGKIPEVNKIISFAYFGGVYLYVNQGGNGKMVAMAETADDTDETELYGELRDSETLAQADAVTLGRELARNSLIAAKQRAEDWGVPLTEGEYETRKYRPEMVKEAKRTGTLIEVHTPEEKKIEEPEPKSKQHASLLSMYGEQEMKTKPFNLPFELKQGLEEWRVMDQDGYCICSRPTQERAQRFLDKLNATLEIKNVEE